MKRFSCKDLKGIEVQKFECCEPASKIRNKDLFHKIELKRYPDGVLLPMLVFYHKGKKITMKEFDKILLYSK